jgi:gamma-glutamylcyclotransferase (GGCT)/AIG2-like uncharacterized protein YtfP
MVSIRLFTYGTLQPGESMAARIASASSRDAELRGYRLFDSGLGWPFAARGNMDDVIHGRLVDLSTSDETPALTQADEWESFNKLDLNQSLFLRRDVIVLTDNGPVNAQAYVSDAARITRLRPGAHPRPIPEGRWRSANGL